eukprot:gene8152-24807_t
MVFVTAAAVISCAVLGAPAKDEIKEMPGWAGALPSKQYSGFLSVTDANNQHIMMHYNFVESQGDPATDPIILWQQGGPGSSGFGYGYMTELGPFHLDASSLAGGANKVGNVLILEHPPGTGFSYCHDGKNNPVDCKWNDETQGAAYVLELEEWFGKFPEYLKHDMFFTGESYAGLLVPNLMDQMVKASSPLVQNLKGVALGNACTGQPGQTVANPGHCNLGGNFDQQHNMDMFFGHGMMSKKNYNAVYAACNFTCGPEVKSCSGPFSAACQQAMGKASDALGDYNIYNIYDTCGSGNMTAAAAASSPMATMVEHMARLEKQNTGGVMVGGGPPFPYPCGTGNAVNVWMNNADVRKAINVPPQSFYGNPWPNRGMTYSTYTHASIDLWPDLIKKFRVVIYNGDVDACVPYNGNEDWTAGLDLPEKEAWRPWTVGNVPAGYVTTYSTTGPADFTFITVKDAGHLVP